MLSLASARYRSRFCTVLRDTVELRMLSNFEEILRAALALPGEARAMLADRLLESLDGPNQKEIDAAWAEEAERRMREIDEGKVEAIEGELVMQKLRARRKRRVENESDV